MNDIAINEHNLISQIRDSFEAGELEQALEISTRALKTDPVDLEVYHIRWQVIAKMFSDEEAKEKIHSEVENLLKTLPETTELLDAVYWGYKCIPGGAINVPQSLVDRILQYPKTEVYIAALMGLSESSENALEKWHYYKRVVDEFTPSDVPELSWYILACEELLWLAKEDRTLARDDLLDELLDILLDADLKHWQDSQKRFRCYAKVVEWRITLNLGLDKALELLDSAEIEFAKKAEQAQNDDNEDAIEKAYKEISRLRGMVYFYQKRWKPAYHELTANSPDFLESVWTRFNDSTIDYFWMLGRSAEGMGNWENAKHYYANAHFTPNAHNSNGLKGLKSVYQQIRDETTTDSFETFLEEVEAEYRIQEDADCGKIRQKLIKNRLNKKATDFSLETLDGETYTLSGLLGKVVMLDVGASWCGPCNEVLSEVKTVYERFQMTDDVVVLGINDGEKPEQVQKFLDEHNPPWTILLDPYQKVRKSFQIKGIPSFIMIDKEGNWQYSFLGSHIINGQPLIWFIEELLSD